MIWRVACAFALLGSAGYAAQRNGRIAFVNGPDVYTVAPDGSNVRQLTRLGPDAFAELPSWEPSDEHIIYTVRHANGKRELWIMKDNGNNQHLLLDDPGYGNTAGMFSPDGLFVVFSRCRGDAACGIYEVRIDGTALRPITNLNAGFVDSFPTYSTDGTSIAFERRDSDDAFTVMLVGRDGSHLRALTRPGARARHPAWSLDGVHLAFSCDCDASGHFRIWLADREGEELTPVVPLASMPGSSRIADHLFPSWSPDEKCLAVEERSDLDDRIVIVNMAVDVSGGPFRDLLRGREPSWSQAP